MIQSEITDQIIQFIKNQLSFQRMIRKAGQSYHFKQNINILTKTEDIITYLNNNKSGSQKTQQQIKINDVQCEQAWKPNQYKMFCWISLCYSQILNIKINIFSKNQKQYLYSLFQHKKKIFIDYTLCSLIKTSKSKKQDWNIEKQKILMKLLKNNEMKYQWSAISYQFFLQSEGKFYKSPQQCRQRWHNYLNPVIKKGKWTKQEDLNLCQLVLQYGTRWAVIANNFIKNRNVHMIKNRYKSIIKNTRYYKKQILIKINSNKQINEKRRERKTKQTIFGQKSDIQSSSSSKQLMQQTLEMDNQDGVGQFLKEEYMSNQQQISLNQIYEKFNFDLYYPLEVQSCNDKNMGLIFIDEEQNYNFCQDLFFNKVSILPEFNTGMHNLF